MVYFRLLGRLVLRFFAYLGELFSLVGQIGESLLRGKKRWRQFFEQIAEIGYRSQLVVIITGGFTGAVLAAQALFQFSLVDMESMGGVIVSVGLRATDSRQLLDLLFHHINQPENQVRFHWTEGAMAIWDNRCTWHYATADYLPAEREMHRVTVISDARVAS